MSHIFSHFCGFYIETFLLVYFHAFIFCLFYISWVVAFFFYPVSVSNTAFYGRSGNCRDRMCDIFGARDGTHHKRHAHSCNGIQIAFYIFATGSKSLCCKSIFHLAKAITDAQRGTVTYTRRQNVFTLSGVCFPGGAICL